MLNVFIGYDAREDEAYQVCKYSLESRAKQPLRIFPLKHRELRQLGIFNRPWRVDASGQFFDERDGRPFSTEFSHSRFAVPLYAKKLGLTEPWALFIDLDFLFLRPVDDLFALVDSRYAVMVCQHEHKPVEGLKMDGVVQTTYPRKNWSSLILWNLKSEWNAFVTLDAVNYEPGQNLHRFKWLPDSTIGALPKAWNWIEGAVPADLTPKAVHYSAGGPWFDQYKGVRYAAKWLRERDLMRRALWKP